MGYDRLPAPIFKSLGPDTIQQEPPQFECGRVYRLNQLDLPTDLNIWTEFVVVRTNSHQIDVGQAILVEMFVVLLTEWQDYVEPLQTSALN